MRGFGAVLWREYIFFKRRWLTITLSSAVAPLLYLLAFGLGLGRSVSFEGISYINFLVPGILALSTMNASFNAVATPLTIARLYDQTLEEYLIAPLTIFEFMVGKITAAALRGLYSAVIIYGIALAFGANFPISVVFIVLLFLNCLVFASLGFWAALIIKTHSDMARVNSFIITPMTFICGTFFSLDKLPKAIYVLVGLLPLTPASQGLRAIAFGKELNVVLLAIQAIYLVVFFLLGYRACSRTE